METCWFLFCYLNLDNTDAIISILYNIIWEEIPYWRELNLAVGFQIAIANILADLNWQFGTGSPYVY